MKAILKKCLKYLKGQPSGCCFEALEEEHSTAEWGVRASMPPNTNSRPKTLPTLNPELQPP